MPMSGATGNHQSNPTGRRGVKFGKIKIDPFPPTPYMVDFNCEVDHLAVFSGRARGTARFDGDRDAPFDFLPHSMAFHPTGCDVFARAQEVGDEL